VNSAESNALLSLSSGHFQGFADAAEAVLGSLEGLIPGTVLLGRYDFDDGVCRVIDVQGAEIAGVERGSILPLASAGSAADERADGGPPDSGGEEALDPEFLRNLSVQSWLASPLEMRDGNLVGSVCALSDRAESYHSGDLALLAVGARLLSYEWASLEDRTELRRLRDRLRDDQRNDSETGIRTRESLLNVLEREWRLVKRGTLESVVLAVHVQVDAAQNGGGGAMGALAFKDVAAVLAANTRITDHVGRIGERDLGAVLVGCPGLENAQAFVRRFKSALQRATQVRPFSVSVSVGMQDLTEANSPVEAIELAEAAAHKPSNGVPTGTQEKGEART
jgi:GGDEF domain-containing protein